MIRIIFLFLLLTLASLVSFGQESKDIVDDDFANNPFGKTLFPKDVAEILNGKFNSKKEPISNKFTGDVDTLLIFNSNVAELIFYKNVKSVFFYKANICGKGISLAKGIEIGMSKDDFITSFRIKTQIKIDQFVIKNTTEYANHKFYFKNNKLARIELDTGMD